MNHEPKDNNGNESLYRHVLGLLKEMYLRPQGIEMDCLIEGQIDLLLFDLLIPMASPWVFILKRRLAQRLLRA